jgi:hypothetical protein
MENTKEIISRIKFIGKIQPGDKINTRYMYIQPKTFFTSISRTLLNYDNRYNTITFLQESIYRCFDLITLLQMNNKESDKLLVDNILKDLEESKTGILNLKQTYEVDIKFCCDIDTMIEYINARLSEYIVKDNFKDIVKDNFKEKNLNNKK